MGEFLVLAPLVVNLILGVSILLRNPKSLTNRLYTAFVFALSVWILANFLENEPTLVGPDSVAFFLRLDFAFAPILFYFLFRFAIAFVHHPLETPKYKWIRLGLIVITLPAIISPFIANTLVGDINFSSNVIAFTDGPLMTYYSCLIGAYIIGSLIILHLGRRAAMRQNALPLKHQINLIFVGAALSLGIAVIVNLIQAYEPISVDVSRIGLYGMVFIVMLTAYAMASARFFEIKLSIGRAIASLFLTVAVAVLYALALFAVSQYIFHVGIDTRVLVYAVFAIAIIASTFDLIRKWVQGVTDKVFFQERYVPDLVHKELNHTLVETIELGALNKKISTLLRHELRIQRIASVFVDGHEAIDYYRDGFNDLSVIDLSAMLVSDQMIQSFDTLPNGPLKELFSAHEIAVTVQLRIERTVVGLLVLGDKLSGKPFSEEDILFLEVTASEIAVGIQNARSYASLKKLISELEARLKEPAH